MFPRIRLYFNVGKFKRENGTTVDYTGTWTSCKKDHRKRSQRLFYFINVKKLLFYNNV